MNNLNIFLKLKNLLYIYQSGGYVDADLISWAKNNKVRFGLEKKKKLDWTLKAELIYTVSIIIMVGLLIIFSSVALVLPQFWAVGIGYIVVLVIGPLEYLLVFANLLLTPFDAYLRKRIVNQAKSKLRSHDGLIVIGITGSYAKTTTTRFLATILSQKYRVLHGTSSFNTPLGVSRVVLNDLEDDHEVLLVEMGADKVGDIKELCDIVSPQLGIITGINEAHLEKFGTIENTIKTKFELAGAIPNDGLIVLNGEDKRLRQNYKDFVKSAVVWANGLEVKGDWSASDYRFDGKEISFKINLSGKEFISQVRAPILGRHNVGNIIRAVAVASHLGLTPEEIKAGISNIKPIEHRLEPLYPSSGVIVIDDSYNGNPDGVKAAVAVLREYVDHRKVYLTPGLVEIGSKSEAIHVEMGELLATTADMVLLIKNKNTPAIIKGLKNKNFPSEKITIFESSEKAYNSFESLLKPGDVILFQNDFPDSYN